MTDQNQERNKKAGKAGKSCWINKINQEVFEPGSCTHWKINQCGCFKMLIFYYRGKTDALDT